MWGVLIRRDNWLDGYREHLDYRNLLPVLFRTRREARDDIAARYGYLRNRPDLRAEPHGWKMPVPVKVEVRKLAEESTAGRAAAPRTSRRGPC